MISKRKPSRSTARCAVGIVIAALACAGAAQSTTPGANGLIVYTQEVAPEHYQLFTIQPDGSGRRQITRGPDSSSAADWAPNGRSIVYGVERPGLALVAIASADGSGRRILTPTGLQGNASFSPDGKWVVYGREDRGRGIWIMRANGTKLRRLTRNPFATATEAWDDDPNFSPNGKLVTFVRIKKDGAMQALFVVRRDGSGLRQLTPYSWDVSIKHDWSPDGKLILLTTNADFSRPGNSANMVTIRLDGSGKTELTHFTGGQENAYAGSFSPDGKQIVFRLEEGDTFSLAVADSDGGNVRQLTTGKDKPRFSDWGTSR